MTRTVLIAWIVAVVAAAVVDVLVQPTHWERTLAVAVVVAVVAAAIALVESRRVTIP